MNQTNKEDELQKAIDDIASSNNNFNTNLNRTPSSFGPKDPGTPMGAIDLDPPAPSFDSPATPPVPPSPSFPTPPMPSTPEPLVPEPDTKEQAKPEPNINKPSISPEIEQVKEKALRDLIPLLGKMNINAEQKFHIYKDSLEILNDKSVLEPAYEAAQSIEDEEKRAESLLEILNIIDSL